ncbi:hypothetical protein PR048_031846 [Dryococelus australis]|uniref:Uncharacterized protein n=1 Tax=Dryococelus australis TaxID=614101 RepID=A0ABQ9G7F1_9NEOP|nr:hypothetical protein PR048_031846 [Dryococelus australis]
MLVAGTKVNSTECSRAVVDILLKYEVKYENVCSFDSDSATYMGKCAKMLKVLVSENLLHIQCWAHKLNLVHQHTKEETSLPPVSTRTVTSAAVEYFKQLEEEEITVLKCQSKFVVEHCKQTVDLLKILEGSSYPFAHKLHSKLSDLKTCFKLVSDRVFDYVLCSLANPSCLKASTAATGQKFFLKLSSLVGADPASCSLKMSEGCMTQGPEVDALDVETRVKTLPFLSSLSLHQMLEGRAVINASGGDVDVLAILLSLKNYFQEYSCCAVKCLWIPVANADSERAFSQYNNIMTVKHTALKADNIEIMLGMCFGAV